MSDARLAESFDRMAGPRPLCEPLLPTIDRASHSAVGNEAAKRGQMEGVSKVAGPVHLQRDVNASSAGQLEHPVGRSRLAIFHRGVGSQRSRGLSLAVVPAPIPNRPR